MAASSRIPFGDAMIEEHPDWKTRHPLGPVHWNVYVFGELKREDIPANELPAYLVQNNWLVQW